MSLCDAELTRFAAGLAGTPERWRHLVRHDSASRVYEQIWDEQDVNAWVICWSDQQDTGFHDHDDSAAAIVGIEGRLQEERMRFGGEPQVHAIAPGAAIFVPSTAIHRVRHLGTAPAITIHAYSPPLRRTGTYRIAPGGELERVAQSFEQELRAEPALSYSI
jgi:quercetin dioxygenase-like cupin family protein